MWKTWIQSLGWEDPLEKGEAIHSSILAWRIPWTVQFMGLRRVGHDWATYTFTFTLMILTKPTEAEVSSVEKFNWQSTRRGNYFKKFCFKCYCCMCAQFSSVQLSRVQLFVTPWTSVHQPTLSITNSRGLFKLMSIESVMPSNHLILCYPLLLLPSIFPSLRVFSNESVLHIRWPKYCSFSFNISPSNEHAGLISFRMDWLDLLAVQGTLRSLQHHSSKASIFQCSAFFIVQLSHPYGTTGKTVALTRWTFAGKVMSLLLICCLGWS